MSPENFSLEINPRKPHSIQYALETEWLLTNGIGGYAMGTAMGVNTRRYHGLLIAATQPPVRRILALHSLTEQIVIGDETIDLATQQFGDERMLHPEGWKYLKQVQHTPGAHIRWIHQVSAMRITKTLSLLQGRNAAMLSYRIEGVKAACIFRLRPFTPMRDFHGVSRESSASDVNVTAEHGALQFSAHAQEMRWFGQVSDWRAQAQWWRNFAYVHDRQRGQEWHEDVWSGGYFECAVAPLRPFELHCAISVPTTDFASSQQSNPCVACDSTPELLHLDVAAEQFIVHRRVKQKDSSTTVIAGYPWFGDWGRDTMIALPGLMLARRQFERAESTLLTFAQHLHNGLIPNLFDEYGGAAHYNTVDASLWFVHAVHALSKATGAHAISETLLTACREIIAAYRRGTDFNIRMDDDGLIIAGDETTQLTWMDAKRDGVVFTARHGKPVEISALWHNALQCVAEMTEDEPERADLQALAAHVARSFQKKFWWEQRACLHDVLPAHEGGVRPNQIFAVSLPFSPLLHDQQRAVVKTVGTRLLTPYGLRTLDCDDPRYCPRYEGDMFARDRAYHNGTVWPWLIGPYCEALLRVQKFSAPAKRKVRAILQPLLDEMRKPRGGCLNQIAEVYDGSEPHRPSGCPAQAWSVAEVLRIAAIVST